jgi:transposase-like protein
MAVGQRTTYYFLGRHPVESAPTLEEAIRNLVDWWTRQPSLVPHEMGNMEIQLTIGGTTVKLEITDPYILDEARYTGPMAVIDYLAEKMGIDPADAKEILEQASATVEVTAIRVPGEPDAWKPDPGMEADKVLPEAMPDLLQELAREEDIETDRDTGRPRSARGRQLVEMAVRAQQRMGLSIAEMSRRTGIPRTTLRDTRNRLERQARVQATFKDRKPGQRLTQGQTNVILSELQNNKGNAAATARQLGIAPRTVREVRQRTQRAATPATPTGAKPRKYTQVQRDQLLNLVKSQGITATEAGRRTGVPSRTARGWVRKARLEAEQES